MSPLRAIGARLRRLRDQRGLTLVELASVSAIIIIMASVTFPVANTMVKRQKEIELRRALRTIRTALDRFQIDTERFPGIRIRYLDRTNEEGYPEDLAWLYEGVDIGDAAGTTIKYLRRLPRDPITGLDEWDTRSSRDEPESIFSDGINIFDVRSKSDKIGLDGTRYNTW
ncbi:MAG: general secretion pathway protein GspG [Acidobacteria bacterium]|nr:general secretion pathway protein GspG [Acidobacteriota bacterium]NIM60829.1 general secretion pathway protein GspG [Acidobacteriota bacterium]NIO58680.1 general secretion pathway protein GspG [Acidobacteriota bacterium]NIQ29736.1 general secretion pathway protein GspG [Acidobacteriota bacterium]NIQ84460.1 general secretion pathway protein GspG [Acidobacteriota bacterium]